MKALVFHKPHDIRCETVPDPKLEKPDDIILRVTSTAICGSDLHIYNGFFPQARPMVLGHEFMGIVEEAGKNVKHLKRGDRVIVPFPVACGACWFCLHDLPGHCEKSNPQNYGPEGGTAGEKGGGLFGYTDLYGGYAGGQAQYVRVPYADFGPRKVPDELTDEQVLFLTDIAPTGWMAVEWAQLKGGETVCVFGCGPVGLMAMKAAKLQGAKRVIGVDIEGYRLTAAKRVAGAEVIKYLGHKTIERIREETGGRGPDVCIDAVGLEARRTFFDKLKNVFHAQTGSIRALDACISTVRRGGFVSVVGVYGMPYDAFPLGQIFDKGLGFKMGQAPVHHCVDRLMDLVVEGKLKLGDIISHELPLEQGPKAYEVFSKKQDRCVKVVLKP